MEIKIDINLNLQNANQIIEKLSYIINKTNKPQNIKSQDHIQIDSTNKEISTKANENKVTIDEIREKISELSQIGKIEKAKEILSKYNSTKVSQINAKDYENINNELNYELSS
ncbi:hypothetical protein [Romboutsia sp.]|uniref:hypothetical protein n=1 Tax=Romboutsia sp. TaxID=1965302 RepID=UPI002BE53D7D|nr:hypothetical protein [Romboutsia sp.]HSQ87560.1 hypothetical protein [Romboutsia sp.]